jgi:hypothetical protein
VFGQDAIRDRDIVRVLAKVDETIVHASKLFRWQSVFEQAR